MKFFVDESLPPGLAVGLRAQGHDAVHVRDLGLASTPDIELFRLAAAEGRVLVSEDTDFGTLLVLSGEQVCPSVLLFRKATSRRSEPLLALLDAVLPQVQTDLERGAIVVVTPERIRVRLLPLR